MWNSAKRAPTTPPPSMKCPARACRRILVALSNVSFNANTKNRTTKTSSSLRASLTRVSSRGWRVMCGVHATHFIYIYSMCFLWVFGWFVARPSVHGGVVVVECCSITFNQKYRTADSLWYVRRRINHMWCVVVVLLWFNVCVLNTSMVLLSNAEVLQLEFLWAPFYLLLTPGVTPVLYSPTNTNISWPLPGIEPEPSQRRRRKFLTHWATEAATPIIFGYMP